MIASAWTIARRELRSLLDHPTAYILVVAFLGVSLYLTFRNIYALGTASLRPLFDLLPTLLAVLIPAITMRTLAEERRGRTLDRLLAQPVSEGAVVLGKFIGSWLFVLIALAGTVPTAIGILALSTADPGIMVAQYLGAALLGGQLTAVGVWASSVTRNQITAFIVAAVIGFTLFLIGLPGIQMGVSPTLAGILARLSVLGHFESVARGVIDLRDIIYFVSVTALFLALAVAAVIRIRLSAQRPETVRLRVGTAAVAVIVITVNLLGDQVHGRLDLTRNDLFTLSPGTRQILSDLDDLVQVTLFASDELPPEVQLQLRDVRDLLSDLRRSSDGDLAVMELNPDDDAQAAEQASSYGIEPIEFNVLRDDEFQIRRGYYGLVVSYAGERAVFPAIQRTDDLEFRLASAIAGLTSRQRGTIGFVTNGNARPPSRLPGLQQSLGDRYEMSTIDLASDSLPPPTPDTLAVLVVAGPTQPLDSLAVQRVRSFVAAGGSALLLLDPVEIAPQGGAPRAIRTGLEGFLEEQGVRPEEGLVMDLASAERISLGRPGSPGVVVPYPLWPLTRPGSDHLITRGLGTLGLGWSGSYEVVDSVGVSALWATTDRAGLHGLDQPIAPEQDWQRPPDELAVRVVALALDRPPETPEDAPDGRIVLVGDVTFTELEFVQSNPQNLTFLANAIDWLAQDEALIQIRSKNRTPPALVFTADSLREALRWGNLVGVPLLFVLFGLARVTGRRRRAEQRWKEVVAP